MTQHSAPTGAAGRLATRTLGVAAPLTVSAMGLGCMGMSEIYGTGDERQGVDTIRRALDLGVTFRTGSRASRARRSTPPSRWSSGSGRSRRTRA